MGMKLLPCNFSNLIFLPQCIKQPANCQAAYFPIWNNFCCDNICVYFLELGSLAKRTKTKRKKKNPLSGQCSVLKTKQSSLIFFGYLLQHYIIFLGKYSEVLDQLVGKTVDYVNGRPELRTLPTEDMFTYFFREYDVEDD